MKGGLCMNTCFLYGSLGGDIIGSRYEHHNIKDKSFDLFSERSHLTDDSIMTIATADAIIHAYSFEDAYQTWGNRYPKAGYGFSFRKWLKSTTPLPYNSWGNGAAMRVSPVGYAALDIQEALNKAKATAEVTHNHPEGIKGAQAAALAVFMAKMNFSKESIKMEIEHRFGYDLSSRTLNDIRPNYSFDVSCQGTLPVALLAFLESSSYEDAIRNAISVGGDSDTIAAIAGGIALAFYKKMPELIIQEIEKRLPVDIKKVCSDFNEYCML